MQKEKEFAGKVVVVTGGARGIGRALCERFREASATVCTIDRLPNDCFVGDVGREEDLAAFARQVIERHGRVDCFIHNAKPGTHSLWKGTWEEFNEALRVGISAAFYLTKLFQPYFAPGASVTLISSSRDRMSQAGTESYSAAKGGVAALTHAMAATLAGRVRVNSISPGWIITEGEMPAGADASQHPAGRAGTPSDIAEMALFLASDRAGFITGENIVIDGGMTHLMIYHDDRGWSYKE